MSSPRNKDFESDVRFMRLALRLAQRAYGDTSPNPMVGAVIVRNGQIIGRGWHHKAGSPHAEVEAIRDAFRQGNSTKGATIYVTLEPCSTHGRTPPCTEALKSAGIKRVVIAATDPNPKHAGRGYQILEREGIRVAFGVLASESIELNRSFNHWIVHKSPFVTVKAAMTLDGKIATAAGESKWITGEQARAFGMRLRQGADAILVGVNTILADDPSLTFRSKLNLRTQPFSSGKQLRRIIVDSQAKTPLSAQVVNDQAKGLTTIIVTELAAKRRIQALRKRVKVWVAPEKDGKVDLHWVLEKLGSEQVVDLLVEGGGETNASFLFQRLAQRVAFFYAPKIIGGASAPRGVSGEGARSLDESLNLENVRWRRLGKDLLLMAMIK